MLKNNGVIQSMSRKGNCLDNSMMESFFGLMKNELLYVNHFESLDRFETELKKYIAWYNTKRVKLRLKGMSPAQYRAQRPTFGVHFKIEHPLLKQYNLMLI